jgi:hypothetical protein
MFKRKKLLHQCSKELESIGICLECKGEIPYSNSNSSEGHVMCGFSRSSTVYYTCIQAVHHDHHPSSNVWVNSLARLKKYRIVHTFTALVSNYRTSILLKSQFSDRHSLAASVDWVLRNLFLPYILCTYILLYIPRTLKLPHFTTL